MEPPFPEYDADEKREPKLAPAATPTRLRDVSVRLLIPNLITLGAICAGLTGVRLAVEGRFELAIVAVVFAAVLDGLDGRAARLLKATTSFGEQMDSLADFVNFGVAPGLILYWWSLKDLHSFGWIAALIFAICGCLRLARFNVMLEDENKPDWHGRFFTGVPAPAGALLALLPVYVGLLGLESEPWEAIFSALYLLLIAFLMVSSLPTWSGKQIGGRVSRRWVMPLMLGIILMVVFLFSYPWLFLTLLAVSYLGTIPFSYREYSMRTAEDEANHSAASGKSS